MEGVQERCARSPRASALRRGMGMAPTFYFRFLDRLSSVLLDSMHLAANYACRRAGELLGEGVGGDDLLHGSMLTVEEIGHERGPMRSVLRAREEDRKRLLEGAAASLKGSSSSGDTVARAGQSRSAHEG